MEASLAYKIKKYIEDLYELPFEVTQSGDINDLKIGIRSQNSHQELFDIEARLKDRIRMIIEVTPERYSAFSIQDMANSSDEKKYRFAQYASQLTERRAKIEFRINDAIYDATQPETWPCNWTSYKLRVTRSPICQDDDFNIYEIALSWIVIVVGMVLSLLNITQDEEKHLEGGLQRVETNKYERNPVNRELCLLANGYACKICGFDFEKTYGDRGYHFIHVHHIVPISTIDQAYLIDPVKELIPVCPNCHAMLHRTDPPADPIELIEMLKNEN